MFINNFASSYDEYNNLLLCHWKLNKIISTVVVLLLMLLFINSDEQNLTVWFNKLLIHKLLIALLKNYTLCVVIKL